MVGSRKSSSFEAGLQEGKKEAPSPLPSIWDWMTSFCHMLLFKAVTSHPSFKGRMNRFPLWMEDRSENWCPSLICHSNSIEVWPNLLSVNCVAFGAVTPSFLFLIMMKQGKQNLHPKFLLKNRCQACNTLSGGLHIRNKNANCQGIQPTPILVCPIWVWYSRWNTESGPLWSPHNSSHPHNCK